MGLILFSQSDLGPSKRPAAWPASLTSPGQVAARMAQPQCGEPQWEAELGRVVKGTCALREASWGTLHTLVIKSTEFDSQV